jgi:selenocysteine lyase/cysteine desulfurase
LIDAAKGSATMPPDLSKYPVDFVALSFYKVYKVLCLDFVLIKDYFEI